MLTNVGKKGFISFGGVYVINAQVLTSHQFVKPPRIVPLQTLNNPLELHNFLLDTQAHLLLDNAKQEKQVFLIPTPTSKDLENNKREENESSLPSLTQQQTSLSTMKGESLEALFKSNKLWDREDRWINKQKRSERLSTSEVISKNEELLFSSVESSDKDKIIQLVKNEGVNINVKKPGSGISSLHLACQNEDTDIVKELIELGAEVNISSKNGSTPLHWASLQGSLEIVELLLLHGADVFATTNSWLTDSVYGKSSGQTPLHWASEKGNISVVFCLLKYGSMPHVTDETGKTPKDISKDEDLKKLLNEEENVSYTPVIFANSSGVATDAFNLESLVQFNNNNKN